MPSNKKKLKYQFFANNLKTALNTWKAQPKADGKKRTTEDFRKAVEAVNGYPISAQSVSNWLTGKAYPERNIDAICSVLNTTEEELNRRELDNQNALHAGIYDTDTLRYEIGLSEEFLNYYLGARFQIKNHYGPFGCIELTQGGYERITPDQPVNSSDDFVEDAQLTHLRAFTSADYEELRSFEHRMNEYLSLLIADHNERMRQQLELVNNAYRKKGSALTDRELSALVPDNKRIKKDYQNKDREIQEALNNGKHKKSQ